MSQNNSQQELTRKNAKTGLIVLACVFGMLGLSFAAVPAYRIFCQVTGFGGTPKIGGEVPENIIDRTVTIHFDANTGKDFPWDFKPSMRSIDVKLGQRGLTSYEAYNKTDHPAAGTAVYNIAPLKAGKYFHKVQCFCFDEQILTPGERVNMPVMFYVDPAMNEDPNMNDVHTITLSYTFYESESKALEEAMEAFYNDEE